VIEQSRDREFGLRAGLAGQGGEGLDRPVVAVGHLVVGPVSELLAVSLLERLAVAAVPDNLGVDQGDERLEVSIHSLSMARIACPSLRPAGDRRRMRAPMQHHGAMPTRVACPCCGYRTLPDGPGAYEVCPVCLWEDDGARPWSVGGPNGISLVEGQQRYLSTGVAHPSERKRARAPRRDEVRDEDWQPLALTEGLLSRVAQAHVELEERLARDAVFIGHGPGEDVLGEYNAAVANLRREASGRPYVEVKERLRGLGTRHGLMFPEAELELLAHLLKDERWRFHHPLQAAAWAWRHRRSAALGTRLRQLRTGTVQFAG
jgi:hypothetical protein